MDLMKMATDLFLDKLGSEGGAINASTVQAGLGELLGGADGQIDLPALIEKFSSGDLASLAQSWLGEGGNAGITADQIRSVLGSSSLSGFAAQLGVDEGRATNALADVIPQLIDQNSSAGNLLESVGGASGLFDMASKLLK